MMMTACDLGAVTKPWEISRKVTKTVWTLMLIFNTGDISVDVFQIHSRGAEMAEQQKDTLHS